MKGLFTGRVASITVGRLVAALVITACVLLVFFFVQSNTKVNPPAPQPVFDQFQQARIYQPVSPLDIPDPKQDGWETEALSVQAEAVLKKLAVQLTASEDADQAAVDQMATVAFSCVALRPQKLDLAYDEGGIQIRRASDVSDDTEQQADYRGRDGLFRAIQA